MTRSVFRLAACALLLVSAVAGLPRHANAETMVEYSAEVQFQLDLIVPEAALRPHLPAGWTLNVSPQGNAKDVNLRAVFIDRLTINGPDGKPAGKGSNRLVYLIAPVKDPSGAAGQLVIGGLSEDPADAPGPFGVYLRATTHSMRRSTSSSGGQVTESQDWVFGAATGEHLEMHIEFERGVANKGETADVRFYSAKNPGFYQISRQDRVLEVLRNATTHPPDHVKSFSFKASGGSFAKLFDGTQKVMSWDNISWIHRTVLLP
jgi:hypothetical protein